MTEKICEFIRDYARTHGGIPPSRREIREGCNVSSLSIVSYHIRNALADGELVRVLNGARGVTHPDIVRAVKECSQ